MTKVVEFSDEEISVALALIELGAKTAGLPQFGNAAFLASKLQNASEKSVSQPVLDQVVEDVAPKEVPPGRAIRRKIGSDAAIAN